MLVVGVLSTGKNPWSPLLHELERSRRYGWGLTVVRLPVRRSPARRPPWRRRVVEQPEAQVVPLVRETDVVWTVGPFLYLLLPGVGRDGAERLVERLAEHEPTAVSPEDARAASFPEDGLTGNALLAAMDQRTPLLSPERVR
jgi:hypothetical protein